MLLVGLLRSRVRAPQVVPVLTLVTLGVTAGLCDLAVGRPTTRSSSRRAGDRRPDAGADDGVRASAASRAVLLSWRSVAPRRGGRGRVLRAAADLGARHGRARRRRTNLVALFIGFELLSIPLYVLCATHMRREHSLESGLKYLIIGSVGSATLLYGLAFLYGATGVDRLRRDRRRCGATVTTTCCCSPASRSSSPAWRSRRRSRRSTSGRRTSTRAPRRRSPAFMAVATKAAAFGVILRLFDVALIDAADDVGAGAGGARGDHDRRRQRRRDRPVVAEAHARLLVRRAGGLHARRRRRHDAARRAGDRLLPRRLRC